MAPNDPPTVHPGDHVQVWNRYLREWAGDFEVVEEKSDGYKVRHPSERICLPGTVRPDRLRPVGPGLGRGWSG